jgi:hypothetical protein
MPFGLTNAPTTFQSLMNQLFAAHLRKFVIVFFDDILNYNKSSGDHMSHLTQVLSILRENSLTAKKSKCIFATSQEGYLSHIISANGVATNPAKILAIQSLNILKSVTQLRSFLGLTGYYKRFIRKESFCWMPDHTTTFTTLNNKMTTAPALALPNFYLPFTFEIDTSGLGIGVVLMQVGKPISFYSQSLRPRASTQSIYHKEALAILQDLKN